MSNCYPFHIGLRGRPRSSCVLFIVSLSPVAMNCLTFC
jgi:hypothetical protein